MNLNPALLIRDGGVMMMVLLGLACVAALSLIALLVLRATGRKVSATWLGLPALTVWSVATISTWQGLRVVRATVSQVPEEERASMAAAGYGVAHAHAWLGWGLAAILFLCAALGLGMVALGTAGKGATVSKKTLALMLLTTILMTPVTGGLCLYLGDPQAMLFAGSATAVVITLGMLALTLASIRIHPDDEARQAGSASARVAVALFATLAVVCGLMSFAMLGEIEAFNGLAHASADMQQMIVAKGLQARILCYALAKWLTVVLLSVSALVCRPVMGHAMGPDAHLGKRTLMATFAVPTVLFLGLSNAENRTMEEGIGYNVHQDMWAKIAEFEGQ